MAEASDTAPAAVKSRRRFTVDALFTDSRPQAVGVADLPSAKEIQLKRIAPDPDQPRRTFDEGKLEELAESIRREGILQPIAVRYHEASDRYIVIHGERRWRAAKLAGLTALPAVVRDVPADRLLVQQLMENIVRDDLNAIDRAAALRALKSQLGDVPWDAVAESVGIRRSRLFQLLGTEKLPVQAQADLRSGRLNEKQSRALQGLPNIHQEVLREAIVTDEIPAAEAIRLAKALRGAHLPDDRATIRKSLSQLRAPVTQERSDDPTVHLLSLVAAAPQGHERRGHDPKSLATTLGAEPYSNDRTAAQIRALAESLSRMPESETRRGSATYPLLTALRSALAALLEP